MPLNRTCLLNEHDIQAYLFAVGKIAKDAGKALLTADFGEITDTLTYKGHESSSIDEMARCVMQSSIDKYLPFFQGTIRCELRPFRKTHLEFPHASRLCLIIDELDGTTNSKRAFSGHIKSKPAASISVAVSLSENIGDIVAGAVFTLDTLELFSAMKAGPDSFFAFYNGSIVDPENIACTRGDSKKRLCVPGYSNSHRKQKAELEEVLWSRGFRPYEGCRASSVDVLNVIRNGFDAYIDLRHFWSSKDENGAEKEAMLQAYDIAGVLPIALGCGLAVNDAYGDKLSKYGIRDTIPIVIARTDIMENILSAIRPLVCKWSR